jgi:hypothetical protein
VIEEVVQLPAAEKVISVLQDDSDTDGECNDDLGNDDSGTDDSEDKAIHIPFMMTSSGIMWYKWTVCFVEEYDFETKVVLHGLEVIKQGAGSNGTTRCSRPDNDNDDLTSLFIVI